MQKKILSDAALAPFSPHVSFSHPVHPLDCHFLGLTNHILSPLHRLLRCNKHIIQSALQNCTI